MTVIGNIGGRNVTSEQLRYFLSITGELPHIFIRMAEDAVITAEARHRELGISNEELQKASDEFRRAHGLLAGADVQGYFEARGWTIEEFETFLEQQIIQGKVREALFPRERVEAFFQEHIGDFKRVALSQILCESRDVAAEIHEQVKNGEADFRDAAKKHSRDRVSGLGGGFIGFVRVAQLPREIQGLVLSASAGDIVGPLASEQGGALFRVEAVQEAVFSDEIALEIRETLFVEWLREQLEGINPKLIVPEPEAADVSAPLDVDDLPDENWGEEDIRSFMRTAGIAFEKEDSKEVLLGRLQKVMKRGGILKAADFPDKSSSLEEIRRFMTETGLAYEAGDSKEQLLARIVDHFEGAGLYVDPKDLPGLKSSVEEIRTFMTKQEIPFNENDTKEQLLDKILDLYGDGKDYIPSAEFPTVASSIEDIQSFMARAEIRYDQTDSKEKLLERIDAEFEAPARR